jgi:hypothetical protein
MTLEVRRRDWRVASLIISTNSDLSATAGSWREGCLRRKPVCAWQLNEALPNWFDVDAGRRFIATPGYRQSARRSRRPRPWPARPGGCGL